jgi:hypothetical protein
MWNEVDQTPSRKIAVSKSQPVRMALNTAYGHSTLWITISAEVAAQIGWTPGSKVGLSLGADKFEGWIKLFTSRWGRQVKRLAKNQQVFTIQMAAPKEWHGLTCKSTACDMFRTKADELLVQIPWDFSEVETGPAGHEVAA